ncbi:tautomerase family protein [Geobacter argillaceus]|uniref:Tautomerase-like protein n=1 Tax=Geobacter argillaceus TaxID=345631 RepID=A0A562VN44_9BACT|nr:tautomerase family protein [Geobacter argillaceus]TWJ19222.1 tautomerase-like protein [Geobacter argillaceus]
MPLAKIEVRRSWPPDQVQSIIEAIYLAQREALKVPERDRQIRFFEHKPEHFHVPPGKTENFILVEIALFAGRTLETKRSLYQAIIKNLSTVGIAPDDIFIVLHDIPLDNWGIRGGVPASEVDLGFKVDV